MTMTSEPPTERSVMGVIRAARPFFGNAYDKVAFAVHATLFASGFVLRATGPAAFSSNNTNPFPAGRYKEVGINDWNQVQPNYAFVYTKPNLHPKSGNVSNLENIVVKCLGLNGKLHVDALSKGVDPSSPHVIAQMEINVEDYVPEETIKGATNFMNRYYHDYNSMFEDLGDLVRFVHNDIVTKLTSPPSWQSRQPTVILGKFGSEVKKPTEQSVWEVMVAARPSFRNGYDKLAFAVHATISASGFVLRATRPVTSWVLDLYSSNPYDKVDIQFWDQDDKHYAFLYSKPGDRSRNFYVKCFVENGYLEVIARKLGSTRIRSRLRINIKDHVTNEANTIKNKYSYGSLFKNFEKLVRDVYDGVVYSLRY
ncbi:OLC1v1019786C1 [Oldenlandia corymbosa var. corymbosa]|uniref:OLC1v1019786C1 n=1 Tax=Oldenlandia corymbosa var. corymbosa TaxID=529605 RepID=A0AAV1EEY8_OLDCO|nr:OLC1v1019786C1 [Oldenlandia corymbosa var. corymbosa]